MLPHVRLILLVGVVGCGSADRADPGDTAGDTAGPTDSGPLDSGDSGADSGDTGDTADTADTASLDADGDGYPASEDCVDTNPAVHPGAREVCNDNLDNDCDGGPGDCVPPGGDLPDEAAAVYLGVTGTCGDEAGSSLVGVGDVDGDGLGELLVGAPWHCGVEASEGAAYLVRGRATPAGGSLADADAGWTGAAAGDNAGASVAAADLDGDGVPDLAIGAPGSDLAAAEGGAVYLLLDQAGLAGGSLAGASAVLTGPVAAGLAGGKMAGAGDVDGDGIEDLLVAAYPASTVWFVRGREEWTSGSLGSAEAYEGPADLAGWGVAGAGDVDGDGLADMLIGAQNNGDGGAASAGAAFLVLGSASPRGAALSSAADAEFTGDSAADYAGIGVAGLGDFNGDGRDDIVVSAPYDVVGPSVGSVYVVAGSADPQGGALVSVGVRFVGEGNDYTGISVAGPGDVDGDGFTDLLVGAFYLGGTAHTGGAWLARGGPTPAGGAFADLAVLYAGAPEHYAGAAVAGAGDVDGDARPDLLIGALDNPTAGSRAGAAYLVRGVGL